jgi:transposase
MLVLLKHISIAQVLQDKSRRPLGQSVGGKTSKIHLAVDAYGLPVTFEITGGDVHESQVAPLLIERLPHAEATVADKGYDSTSIRALIQSKGSKVVIPRKKNSTIGNAALDVYLYKLRHLVENMFARLKHFRAVATRFDKLKRNFVSTCRISLPVHMVTYVTKTSTDPIRILIIISKMAIMFLLNGIIVSVVHVVVMAVGIVLMLIKMCDNSNKNNLVFSRLTRLSLIYSLNNRF